MQIGRVVGAVVPAVVSPGLDGVAMLIVQPLDPAGRAVGRTLVAADATRMAGPGERVYFEGGREAALALDRSFVPIDHAIVGIVDALDRTGSGVVP